MKVIFCVLLGAGQESNGGVSNSLVGNERKKDEAAKLERVRLGQGSASAFLDSAVSPGLRWRMK